MTTEPVSETPPPSPAGYGPAFKGDGRLHDDKGMWKIWDATLKQWCFTLQVMIALSNDWYCKPTEKTQVNVEPEWPLIEGKPIGDWLHSQFPATVGNFHLERWLLQLSDFYHASRAAELTGDKSLAQADPSAFETGSAPVPVARDTGEDVCECGHKRKGHANATISSCIICFCNSFRKRGEQKCDIHTVAPVSGASIKPMVSSPAPGETKGAQLTTELGWLVAWEQKQTRPVDAKLAYKEGYIDAVNIMDSLLSNTDRAHMALPRQLPVERLGGISCVLQRWQLRFDRLRCS